jgi:Tol biopolymer transport system component
LVAVASVAVWYGLGREAGPVDSPVRQLTFDGTINATPAFSPDGKLLAFASDRGTRNNLDIWVRQTAGGGLIRLTSQPGFEAYPQFSPDGTKVFYLSGSGAIFEVPSLGGPSRPVIEDAGPFSISRGGEIAFVKMRPGVYSGPIFISDGSSPSHQLPSCTGASRPSWSPDGKSLLFFGQCTSKGSGAFRAESLSGNSVMMFPLSPIYAWHSMFAAQQLDTGHEAVVFYDRKTRGISRWSADGGQTITRGTEDHEWPAVAPSGQVVFAQFSEQVEIRKLPEQAEVGAAAGVPLPMVSAIGHFAVSRDGSTMVFGRLTGGRSGELVVRDLIKGDERVFASHDLLGVSFGSLWPQVSPSGKQVAYRVVGDKGGIYLLQLPSGEVRRLTEIESFQLPSDWSADGSRILGECSGAGAGICELDPRSGAVKPLLIHPQDQLLYPSVSWDGSRLIFMRRRPGEISGIWTARIVDSGIEPDTAWIRVSPEGADCSRPRFSANGSSVYYVLGRDGLRAFVQQSLNPHTGQPVGEPRLIVDEPMEFSLLGGGTGPYSLIAVTSRGVFYSTFVTRSNLFTTTLL